VSAQAPREIDSGRIECEERRTTAAEVDVFESSSGRLAAACAVEVAAHDGIDVNEQSASLLAVTISGCAIASGIFKAGFWIGIVIAVIVVVLLFALFGRK